MSDSDNTTVLQGEPDRNDEKVETGEPFFLPAPTRIPYWRYILDQPLITQDVLNWPYAGSGAEADPYLVTWIDSDPRNAMNMSPYRKAGTTALMAVLTLAASFMSSTYSGCIPQVMADMHVSEEVATVGLSLYVLGFGVGPTVWAPMGELYGRQIIIFISFGLFTAFNAASAGAQSIQALLVLRFFSGCFAASAMTNTGAVIADMYEASQRGLAMGCFAMAPFMGPVFGPVVGGFLGESDAGWRWVQGLAAIFSGVLWLLTAFLVPETYAPFLLRKRARVLSRMTGRAYVSAADTKFAPPASAGQALKKAMTRPWLLLVHEPPVLFLALYMSLLYGVLYMLFGAFPIVYQEGRGWSQGIGGLAFMGVAVGEIAACLFSIPDNARYVRRSKARGGTVIPEERLSGAMIGAVAVPAGLFWFAWTNGPDVHWLASVAAGAPFGFGMVLLFISIKNYLVDAYSVFAASALAGTVIMRSCFGAAFPLFTTYLYHGLGVHWASTLTAFLSLACTPIPFVLYRWGTRIRANCKYTKQAEAMTAAMQAHR
ncbi:MFS general substrate transporter [Pleurostoma richardsiae]|uniref:MFS general substrate transporter n=1 Tax=Pleurostoma richardsiae TaxID=41990 RepID=A0AA38RNY0_9PEZI|nr:MFS general substrate transporter [Pleurostoma richardsiae]